MNPNELARKPAYEASRYEVVSTALLQASVTLDGDVDPDIHIAHTFALTDLYFQALAQRNGGGL